MEKTALLLRSFSFSSSVQHANQAPVRHLCADLTDNACLAATVIAVAGKTAFWLVYNQQRVAATVLTTYQRDKRLQNNKKKAYFWSI